MEVKKAIRERRSIREYKPDMPTAADIQAILEAGIWAPSGLNNQPWKFKIVKDPSEKDSLAGFTKYDYVIKSAPVTICVFLDLEGSYNRDKDIMAVGACIQNMLLAAQELGLGTCWLGEILNRKDEVREFLPVSEKEELMAVITLGYSAEKERSGDRKDISEFMVE